MMKGNLMCLLHLGMAIAHSNPKGKEGLPHKKPLRGIRAEEVLTLVEEQAIVRMTVIRGDTSPKVEASVNRGNTFPRTNSECPKAVKYT